MKTPLAAAVQALSISQKILAGEPCTYVRGNHAIDHVRLVPTNPNHVDYGDEEASYTSREMDFVAWWADLVLDGQAIVPQRGDLIQRTDSAGIARTYEVLPREDDRCYRPTDKTGLQFRIYTVERPTTTETLLP